MAWNGKDESLENMEERGFELHVGGRIVPGVYWTPKRSKAERLVLLGHGGTTHKKADYIMVVAGLLVGKGIASLAIDGPGHGDRTTEDLAKRPERFEQAWAKDGGHDGMLEDWDVALNFIEVEKGARPTGWWGLSMGTMMGLPVTAADDRIKAALLDSWVAGGQTDKSLWHLHLRFLALFGSWCNGMMKSYLGMPALNYLLPLALLRKHCMVTLGFTRQYPRQNLSTP